MEPECFACFFKQAHRLMNYLNLSRKKQIDILKKVGNFLINIEDFSKSPAFYSSFMYDIVYKEANVIDPYKTIKKKYNKRILGIYSTLKNIVETSNDPIHTALKLSAVGNSMDLGVDTSVNISKYLKNIKDVKFAIDDYTIFKRMLKQSKKIMLLADNTGEIILDKLLLETINKNGKYEIIVGVRGKPIINDVTIQDAKDVEFQDAVKIISNGNEMVGTILEQCSKEFMSYFNSSDIIISKGQANFESLNTVKKHNIFFLFKSKCNPVSKYLNVPLDSLIFYRAR